MTGVREAPKRRLAAPARGRAIGYGLVLVLGCLALGAYSVELGCDVGWDLQNYHYYSAYALLTGRLGFDYAPAQVQTFLNPASFVPFYLAVTHLQPVQTGFLFGALHGVSFGLLFILAYELFASMRRALRLAIAGACAVLGVRGPLFVEQLGTSNNDNLIAPLVLAAILLFGRSLLTRGAPDGRSGKGRLLVAGLLVGAATGLKLVFLAWLVAFAVAIFAVGRGWPGRWRSTALFAAGSVAGVLISSGYWMALLWSKYGSPLFPFYNTIFRSPSYYDHDWFDHRLVPTTLEAALDRPLALSDGRFACALGVVVVSVLAIGIRAIRSRRGATKVAAPASDALQGEARVSAFLAIFFVVGLGLWEAQFSVSRYTVPLELLAPIVILGLLRTCVTRRLPLLLAGLAVGAAAMVLGQPLHLQRREWAAALFNVDAPRFEHPENVIVILADDAPMSYVIPFFQPEVRFVSLANNFTQTNRQPPEALRKMLDRIESHDGPLFALAPYRLRRLQPYGIAPLTVEGTQLGGRPEFAARPDYPPPDIKMWSVEVVPPGVPVMEHRRRRAPQP